MSVREHTMGHAEQKSEKQLRPVRALKFWMP